jgi:homopolymeric O-antigen transport system ATP-binding protein
MAQVIAIEDLGKRYRVGATLGDYGRLTEELSRTAGRLLGRASGGPSPEREFWALRDISFEVDEGEVVGIVGRNGAGKTTLLKILSRITSPTTGRAIVYGRVGSLLEVGTGFHPELSGRENVYLNGAILGMRRREIAAKFDEIVEFAEIQRFIDTPVKRYSSGMAVRLAFSVAAFLEPEILFIDEVLSVGDQAFQQRCLGRMGEIAHSGRTILFVSHSLAAVSALCQRGVLIERGRVVGDGPVEEVLAQYVAMVQEDGDFGLRDREDRQGDGRLRFTGLSIMGPQGAPRTWDDTQFSLFYEADGELPEVLMSFAVEGPLGEPVFHLTNRVGGQDLRNLPRSGEIRCTVPSMPIAPGRYTVHLYCEVNGVLADWIRGAGAFEIVERDVFGSGHLPLPTHGRLVLPHTWSVIHEADRQKIG